MKSGRKNLLEKYKCSLEKYQSHITHLSFLNRYIFQDTIYLKPNLKQTKMPSKLKHQYFLPILIISKCPFLYFIERLQVIRNIPIGFHHINSATYIGVHTLLSPPFPGEVSMFLLKAIHLFVHEDWQYEFLHYWVTPISTKNGSYFSIGTNRQMYKHKSLLT